MKIETLLGLGVMLPLMAGAATPNETKEKPNVLFIFADDLRYDAIQALGHNECKTPNLDRLVKNGVTFTNTYLQGANTGGTSAPSRAQLLSGVGVFDIEDGQGKNMQADQMPTIAQTLSDGGYYTHIIGKSHNGPEYSIAGFQGGDRMYGLAHGYYRPHFKMPVQDYKEGANYGDKKNLYLVKSLNPEVREPVTNYSPIKTVDDFHGVHSSELFGTAAVEFINDYDKEEPFFLYLAMHAPHDTRVAPEKYHKMYSPDMIELPENFLTEHPFDNGDLMTRDEKLAPFPRTEADTKQQLCDYYAIITHLDEWIGNVLNALESSGMADNTVVLFCSDSGLAVGSHGLFGKQSLYDDGGIHVPLIISGVDIPKGKKYKDLCYTYDIYPTICNLTGTQIPSSVKGLSHTPTIRKEKNAPSRNELYFGYRDFQRAIRDDKFKLIQYCVGEEKHTQLFAIDKDPHETKDLSQDPKYADKVRELTARLEANGKEETQEWGKSFWNKYNN